VKPLDRKPRDLEYIERWEASGREYLFDDRQKGWTPVEGKLATLSHLDQESLSQARLKYLDEQNEMKEPGPVAHQQIGIGRSMYFVPSSKLQEFFEQYEGTTERPAVEIDDDKVSKLEQVNAQMELDLKHACQCLNRGCLRCQRVHRGFYPEVYEDG
jgi:hypothetical protein